MTRKESRPITIGFDETNNGLHIKSQNPHYESSLIVTGYLWKNPNKDFPHIDYGAKSGAFGFKTENEESINRARNFLRENHDFFYTSIEKSTDDKLLRLRADAIVLLTGRFLTSYNLDPNFIRISADQIDGPQYSKNVGNLIKERYKQMKVRIPFQTIQGGEHNKPAIRMSDRVGYWISVLHLLGKNHKWPHRHRKVNMRSLEKVIGGVRAMVNDFPQP